MAAGMFVIAVYIHDENEPFTRASLLVVRMHTRFWFRALSGESHEGQNSADEPSSYCSQEPSFASSLWLALSRYLNQALAPIELNVYTSFHYYSFSVTPIYHAQLSQ